MVDAEPYDGWHGRSAYPSEQKKRGSSFEEPYNLTKQEKKTDFQENNAHMS